MSSPIFNCTLLLAAVATTAHAQAPATPPAAALAAPAQAQTGPWTLQRAVDYALGHNLNVRLTRANADLSRVTLRQSKTALLPSANLNGSQVWNFGTNVNPLTFEFKSQTTRSNNFSGVSAVTLFQGFQLRNTIRRNDLDYQASLGDIEQARNDLSLNVASAYLQYLLADELVRANQVRVASSQAQVQRTQQLLKAGSVAESNLLDSQSQLASDDLNVITAQNQLALARLNLVQLLNLDAASAANFILDTPQLADPDNEAPLSLDLDQTFQTAAASLPQIKAADLRVQSARRGIDLARGGYYPRLTLAGTISTGFSSSSTARQITGDSTSAVPIPVFEIDPVTGRPRPTQFVVIQPRQPRFEYLPAGYFNQLNDNIGKTIQFSLSIPILNGLQVRNNVQRSVIQEEQARLRAEQARLTLRQSIEQAFTDARAAQLKYAAAKRQSAALTLSQRNAEIRFNNGLLNGTDFNIAKNNLTGAESGRIQAKYEFIFRKKVLDFYQGKPLVL